MKPGDKVEFTKSGLKEFNGVYPEYKKKIGNKLTFKEKGTSGNVVWIKNEKGIDFVVIKDWITIKDIINWRGEFEK